MGAVVDEPENESEDEPTIGLNAKKMTNTAAQKMTVRLIRERSDTPKEWLRHRIRPGPLVTNLLAADPSVRMKFVWRSKQKWHCHLFRHNRHLVLQSFSRIVP